MAVMSTPLSAEYTEGDPGPYCANHRSVYCADVQQVINDRFDADLLAEVIGGNIGQKFTVAFPIYPQFCIWEVLTFQGVNHDMLGPIGELDGKISPRHKVVHRILPGESAADLAMSLRDNYEAEIEDRITELRTTKPIVGVSSSVLPRCQSSSHSMRYQRLITEMTQPKLMHDEWDAVRESIYALMWTFHYQRQCLFCWTKRAMADAIRVSPDFQVDPADAPADHNDLIPTEADTNRRRSSEPPW